MSELPELLPYPAEGLVHCASPDGAYWWMGEGNAPADHYQIAIVGPMKFQPWAYKEALIRLVPGCPNLEWVSIEFMTPGAGHPYPRIVFDRGLLQHQAEKAADRKSVV